MKRCPLLLLLLLLFVPAAMTPVFSAAARAEQENRPLIKIGLILPLSGGMAHVGAAFRDAARMAIDDIPSDSRFHYQLVIEDDQLPSAKAATAVQKLIDRDKVDAVISSAAS